MGFPLNPQVPWTPKVVPWDLGALFKDPLRESKGRIRRYAGKLFGYNLKISTEAGLVTSIIPVVWARADLEHWYKPSSPKTFRGFRLSGGTY